MHSWVSWPPPMKALPACAGVSRPPVFGVWSGRRCLERINVTLLVRKLIDREGLTTMTREGGAKLHPAVRVESDCRLAFARLLRELDLDLDPPAEAKRPPSLRSIAR